METINRYLFDALERHAELTMQVRRERTWTFAQAAAAIHGVTLELRRRGVAPGDRVAIIAENSPRWLHAYLGILAAGAVAVPRGEDIPDAELFYILEHSECRVVFSGSERTTRRLPARFTTIPLHDDAAFPGPVDPPPGTLRQYAGAAAENDLAVLLYTSGTTGQPKGVMLEHGNIAHNIRVLPPIVDMRPGRTWISVLPSWHTFEQTVELCGFASGCTTIYTDKRHLRDDIAQHRPHYFASVPRIWETIYEAARGKILERGRLVATLFRLAWFGTRAFKKGWFFLWPLHALGEKLFYGKIRAATGGNLLYAVSGGGYLPPHIDEFFQYMGVPLLVGYGLTETSPVVALRDPVENVIGTIGRPCPETEVRIGEGGTILVRGPQVMRGYYKDPELTAAAIDAEGWFDTGDLGRITPNGDIVFIGRKKETIVLSGGENVEPEPIENAILQSPYIEQVMLVGQDRKTIGALVVPRADSGWSREILARELKQRTGITAGFRSFEGVHRFAVLEEPFSPDNGMLTQTLKMRRGTILEQCAKLIDSIYAA